MSSRDLSLCGSMLFLMLCINYGISLTEHYHLNKAVRNQFIRLHLHTHAVSLYHCCSPMNTNQNYILSFSRGHDDAFLSITKHEDWWKWAQTSLLNSLYKNASDTTGVRMIKIMKMFNLNCVFSPCMPFKLMSQ